jgi:hypothetical protein
MNRLRTVISRLCLYTIALSWLALPARAQQPSTASSILPPDHPHKSIRKRVKVSKPADFSGAGLLQFEYGYDGDFHAPDTDKDQVGTACILFNASDDLQSEFDFDTFHSQTSSAGDRATGIGDAYLSLQLTTFSEARQRPSLAFSYLIKIPTANETKGLGTGRVDHKTTVLISKKVHETDIDFNASLLINGTQDKHGWDKGYQIALGCSRELKRGLGLQCEIFGETLDTDQPRGLFAQITSTYELTTRTSLDTGFRVGLNSTTPRFGLSAGVSLSLANLFGS